MAGDPGGLRGPARGAGRAVHWLDVTAQEAKQRFKNAIYRSLGETSAALRLDGNGTRTLRILMYHKVNDVPDNPTTVPVGLFDEQLAQVRALGYTFVDLDAVLDHYGRGMPLP